MSIVNDLHASSCVRFVFLLQPVKLCPLRFEGPSCLVQAGCKGSIGLLIISSNTHGPGKAAGGIAG